MTLTLSNASHSGGVSVEITDNTGIMTITDDEDSQISINDVTTANEDATNAIFTITLESANENDVLIAYTTSNNILTFKITCIQRSLDTMYLNKN